MEDMLTSSNMEVCTVDLYSKFMYGEIYPICFSWGQQRDDTIEEPLEEPTGKTNLSSWTES